MYQTQVPDNIFCNVEAPTTKSIPGSRNSMSWRSAEWTRSLLIWLYLTTTTCSVVGPRWAVDADGRCNFDSFLDS